MKIKQSEIQLWEVIKMLDQFCPIKIIYNKKVLYNDYDSKVEIEPGAFGETFPPEMALAQRHNELLNKLVYSIKIDVVQHHHSIVYITGEK